MMPSTKKILIVDDDERIIRHISDLLDEEGYQISFALNASDAWESVISQDLDLVILDIKLPDGNGYDLCERINNHESIGNLPVIFITGISDNESIEKAFEAGGNDYISKPISNRELLARVKKTLTLSSLRRNLQTKLDDRTSALRKKDSALDELLDRIENRENQTRETIRQQLTDMIEPHLERLKAELSDRRDDAIEYIELIEDSLERIFDERSGDFSSLREQLTPREFEICSFIRKGLTSKEIASTLGRAESTVKNHRRNIREKLGLKNSDQRLADYLMELE